jgi:carbon-monoxide dehydrogenase large subunit
MSAASHGDATSGLGAPVRRLEDRRLLTGRGDYADDLAMKGGAFAYVLRSHYAHARLLGIDKTAALAAPGVLAVLTGDDIAKEKLGGIPCLSFPRLPPGTASYCPIQPLLAIEKVRHVGDRVALVVAETLAQAKDAAELLAIRYEELRAVTLPDAHEADAPKVWDEARSNLSFRLEIGDRRAVEEQFAAAAHITTLSLHYPRISANSMEPRTAMAYRDPMDGRFTLHTSTQGPFRVREVVCQALGMSQFALRVRAGDVGGAFGMKNHVYPEEALVVWAAGKLDRAVKWTADRSEALMSDMHARHQIARASMALDRDGRILAFRTEIDIDVGAYLGVTSGVPPNNAAISYPSTYHIPLIHTAVRATFTNTLPLGPYRGSGKPEATYTLERLVDKAAREMGIDPIALRRRNLIRPSDMPYHTLGGNVYDCGHFEAVLDKAVALADWPSFAERRAASERSGLRRGIGLAMYCQRSGSFSERMEIRVSDTGSVALFLGTLSTGQGHETMFAQMVADWLGVPLVEVRVFQGDTDKVLFGRGSFAQRSMGTGGSALKLAAEEVVKKARRLAAWMLEADEADVVFEGGILRVAGTDRQISFREVAQKSYIVSGLPPEFGVGLDGVGSHPGPYTFPNGCMIAEVEVDPDTGIVKVDRLCAVDDPGTIVNPLTLEGQLHGSVAQGIGETLVEEVVYDDTSGQLVSGSFMDYAMPRADIMPTIESDFACLPTKNNLLGTKGGSEAGNVGAPAAVINAVLDALTPWGIVDLPLPAKPERVWRALQNAINRKGRALRD